MRQASVAPRAGTVWIRMLSTIVACDALLRADSAVFAERLVRTLGSLIAANVEGMLGDVAIAGPGGRGLRLIADEAGCNLIEGSGEAEWLRRAIEAARRPELLILRSGYALQPGFVEEAGDFLAFSGGSAAPARSALLRAAPESFAERLFPAAAPVAGLIASRKRCLSVPDLSIAALIRALKPMAPLRTTARRIG